MSYKTINEKIHNSVQTISLNRPDRLNAWTEEMAVEIKKSMHNASNNADVRVIVLTGTGRGFCAGADMNELNNIDADKRAETNKTSPATALFSKFFNSFTILFKVGLREVLSDSNLISPKLYVLCNFFCIFSASFIQPRNSLSVPA